MLLNEYLKETKNPELYSVNRQFPQLTQVRINRVYHADLPGRIIRFVFHLIGLSHVLSHLFLRRHPNMVINRNLFSLHSLSIFIHLFSTTHTCISFENWNNKQLHKCCEISLHCVHSIGWSHLVALFERFLYSEKLLVPKSNANYNKIIIKMKHGLCPCMWSMSSNMFFWQCIRRAFKLIIKWGGKSKIMDISRMSAVTFAPTMPIETNAVNVIHSVSAWGADIIQNIHSFIQIRNN